MEKLGCDRFYEKVGDFESQREAWHIVSDCAAVPEHLSREPTWNRFALVIRFVVESDL
jgi:hypothetical protein